MNDSRMEEQRDHAWRYFQLHASQRMASFNFFVVLCALLTAGLAGTFQAKGGAHLLGAMLGLSLIVVSFVFWKLDQRVRYLIKHAEDALKEIERIWDQNVDKPQPSSIALFCSEERKTSETKSRAGFLPWQWHLSYSQCFGVMYCLFGTLGLVGFIGSMWMALVT